MLLKVSAGGVPPGSYNANFKGIEPVAMSLATGFGGTSTSPPAPTLALRSAEPPQRNRRRRIVAARCWRASRQCP